MAVVVDRRRDVVHEEVLPAVEAGESVELEGGQGLEIYDGRGRILFQHWTTSAAFRRVMGL